MPSRGRSSHNKRGRSKSKDRAPEARDLGPGLGQGLITLPKTLKEGSAHMDIDGPVKNGGPAGGPTFNNYAPGSVGPLWGMLANKVQ